MEKIDTANDFMVGMTGGGVRILMPPSGIIPKDKALRLAAWIAILAAMEGEEFDAVLAACRST